MRRARAAAARALAALFLVSIAASARAELFGIFYDGPGNDFLGIIDPISGEITTRGSVLDLGGRYPGVSDADPATGRFFFIGAQGDASDMSIWTVDVADGSVLGAHTLIMTGYLSGPFCLRWDAPNQRLLAIMTKSNGDEVLATVNPGNGAIAAIGSGFTTGGLYSACSFDAAAQRFYQVAMPAPVGLPALFRINAATGAVLGSPTISTGLPGVDTTPSFLAYDDTGDRVLGVVNLVPSSAGKVLVSINQTTGAMTLISDAIPAGGASGNVSAFYQPGRSLYFLANDVATNSVSSVFGVKADGTVIANAELSSAFVGLNTTSSFLVIVPEPGAASLGFAIAAVLALLRARRR